ncbi:MAG: hypothetical protein FI725_04655 [SAR202 cluster bacterium]|nr:hypothetical protein [SAR202 cluster bacterium]
MSRQRKRRRKKFQNRADLLRSDPSHRPGILGPRWRFILAISAIGLALAFALGTPGVAAMIGMGSS